MICPKCGGFITRETSCDKCGISYQEMIESVRHDEMKKLFKKMRDKVINNESIFIEESLLATELKNASLLVPIMFYEDSVGVMHVEDEKHNKFITVFTDKEEYDKCVDDLGPATNPFPKMIELLEEPFEGFVINVGGESCEIRRDFIKKYFED